MSIIYLDWAATAPPDPEAIAEHERIASSAYGNPSSDHAAGRAARELLESARSRAARLLGARPEQVIFTSSGTESNNIVLLSLLARKRAGEVVVSGIEHPSVYEPARLLAEMGFAVRFVAAEGNGIVSSERLHAALSEKTVLVALMYVNNETGAIQPVRELAQLVGESARRWGRAIHFHSDCVQALGKIPVDCGTLGVDSASFSGHKLGAPRGAGLLYLKRPLVPLYRGGGQELGLRPGTENLPAIAASVLAIERHAAGRGHAGEADDAARVAGSTASGAGGPKLAGVALPAASLEEAAAHAAGLKRLLVERIRSIEGHRFIPEEVLYEPDHYSPFILNVAFPPMPGEVLVRMMSDRGYAISTGSACSTRGQKHLRVLSAMGVEHDLAFSAIRISTGYSTTVAEVEAFCGDLGRAVASLPTGARR